MDVFRKYWAATVIYDTLEHYHHDFRFTRASIECMEVTQIEDAPKGLR